LRDCCSYRDGHDCRYRNRLGLSCCSLGLGFGSLGYVSLERRIKVGLPTIHAFLAAALIFVSTPFQAIGKEWAFFRAGEHLPTVHSVLRLGDVDRAYRPVALDQLVILRQLE